jgi:hypothetical protein
MGQFLLARPIIQIMRTLFQTILTLCLLHSVEQASGQVWSEDFEAWPVRDSSFVYGYGWQKFGIVTGGNAITSRSASAGPLNNPASPGVLTTGYFKLTNISYTVNFQHRAIGLSSSPVTTVKLVDTNNIEVATLFSYAYVNGSTINSSFTLSGYSGYYRLRFIASGNGGSSRVTVDNISSTIPVMPSTNNSARLSDLETRVLITATDCNAQTVEIRFTNKGPDVAFLYGISGVADLSQVYGLWFNNMVVDPNLRVDTVAKKIYLFENRSGTGLPVGSSVSLFLQMNTPGNCTLGIKASFTGFNLQEDFAPANNVDAGTVSFSMLPVRLSSFEASTWGKGAALAWTAFERQVSRYEVERSVDDGVTFQNLAGIPARNGQSLETYHFTDPFIPAPTAQYRLRMVDRDGHSEYSMVRRVDGDHPSRATALHAYPNPAERGHQLNLDIGTSGQFEVRLVSLSGKLAASFPVKSDGRTKSTHFLPQSIPAGEYVLLVSSGNRLFSQARIRIY